MCIETAISIICLLVVRSEAGTSIFVDQKLTEVALEWQYKRAPECPDFIAQIEQGTAKAESILINFRESQHCWEQRSERPQSTRRIADLLLPALLGSALLILAWRWFAAAD